MKEVVGEFRQSLSCKDGKVKNISNYQCLDVVGILTIWGGVSLEHFTRYTWLAKESSKSQTCRTAPMRSR